MGQQHNIQSDDLEVVDLDEPQQDVPAQATLLQGQRLHKRVRLFLLLLTLVTAIILLALLFPNITFVQRKLFPPDAKGADKTVSDSAKRGGSSVTVLPLDNLLLTTIRDGQGDTIIANYAVSPKSGSLLWNSPVKLKDNILIADDVIYAMDQEGKVVALRASDGLLLWRSQDLGYPIQVKGEYVYVQMFTPGFRVLQASSGKELWQVESLTDSIFGLAEDRLFLLKKETDGASIAALDALTGKVLWTQSVDQDTLKLPVLDHDRIYTFLGSEIRVLNIHDGSTLQHVHIQEYTANDWFQFKDESVFFLDTIEHKIHKVSLTEGAPYVSPDGSTDTSMSGKELWASNSIHDTKQIQLTDDVLVVTSVHNKSITAFSTQTGEQVWYYQTSFSDFAIQADGSSVYAMLNNGQHFIVFGRDGTKVWEFYRQGKQSVSAISKDTVYIVDYERKELFALRLQDGQTIWERPVKELGYVFRNV